VECNATKGKVFSSKTTSREIFASGDMKTLETLVHITIAKKNTTNRPVLKFVRVI
jgi:hypothetical protein